MPRNSVVPAPLVTGAIMLIMTGAYAFTAASTVQGGDAGEFMVIGAAGGVAHPPGYPLYTWLCRLFALLPVGPMAFRTSLTSVLAAAMAIGLLHDAFVRLVSARMAAVMVAVVCGLAPTWWRYATVAEVFAFHGLVTCAALNVAARVQAGWRGMAPTAWMGAVLAVGVAHHHTVVALAPMAAWVAWRSAVTPSTRAWLTHAAMMSVVSAGGMLAYLGLLHRDGAWAWGDTSTFEGLVHHVLRRDYGTFQLSRRDEGAAAWVNPIAWMTSLPREYLGVFLLALPAGILRARDADRRGFVIAVLASVLLAGPVLLALFNVQPVDVGLAVVERFFIMPTVLLAPLVVLGVDRFVGRFPLPRAALVGAALAAAGTGALQGSEYGARHRVTWLEDHVSNAVRASDKDALIIGHGDDRFFAFMYARVVMGLRPDVTYVDPVMLAYPWYRAWLSQQGLEVTADMASNWPRLVREQVAVRPVYLAFHHWFHERARLEQVPPVWPTTAVMLRVQRPGETVPTPEQVERTLVRASAEFQVRSVPADAAEMDQRWEGEGFRQFALGFAVLEDLYRAQGDADGVTRASLLRKYWAAPWAWEGALDALRQAGRTGVPP